MPTPTIQAKLVLTTDQSQSVPTSKIGGTTSDVESKKLNKTIGKLSSTIDFTLGKEGSKAFRVIQWALPAIVGLLSKGKLFGGGLPLPPIPPKTPTPIPAPPTEVPPTKPVTPKTTPKATAGGVRGGLRFGGLAFTELLMQMPSAGGASPNNLSDQEYLMLQEEEKKLLEDLIDAGVMTEDGLRQMADGTIELRDKTGKLITVFGDGKVSAEELNLAMKLTSQTVNFSGNELAQAMIKAADSIINSANRINQQTSRQKTAGESRRRSDKTIADIRAKAYEDLGMSQKDIDEDEARLNSETAKAKIKTVKVSN